MLQNQWLENSELGLDPRALRVRPWLVTLLVGISALGLLSAWLRPLMPVDETRYVTVAWEMWQRDSFFVPYLNGETYEHKPPVLFWLMHIGWWIGGVSEWWPRAIGPLATLAATLLIGRLGGRLWPDLQDVGRLGSLMFIGTWFIALYQTALMFDMPLLACVAAGWCALWDAAASGKRRHWAAFGLALGLGLIVKGPVVLVYTLPVALGLRWWRPQGSPAMPWAGPLLAILLALVPGALWLTAAFSHGDGAYFEKLLIDQTLDRVNGVMGHPRPFWWYLPLVLLLPLPWSLWPPAWRGFRRFLSLHAEPGVRFIALAGFAGFLSLSLIGGKQAHYLIPLMALGFLAIARGLRAASLKSGAHSLFGPALAISVLFLGLVAAAVQWLPTELQASDLVRLGAAPFVAFLPVLLLAGATRDACTSAARLAGLNLMFIAALIAIVFPFGRNHFDLEGAGEHIAAAQAAGRPTLYVGNYQGEFGFFGRLTSPVAELGPAQANAWVRDNPDGLVVVRRKRIRLVGAPPIEYQQPYKSDEMLMLRAYDLVASGSVLREPEKQTP